MAAVVSYVHFGLSFEFCVHFLRVTCCRDLAHLAWSEDCPNWSLKRILFATRVATGRWLPPLIRRLIKWWPLTLESCYTWTHLVLLGWCQLVGSGTFLWSWTTFLAILRSFSWELRMRLLSLFETWFWGWKMSYPRPWERFAVTMAHNSKMLVLTLFAVIKVLNTSTLLPILHSRMEL